MLPCDAASAAVREKKAVAGWHHVRQRTGVLAFTLEAR